MSRVRHRRSHKSRRVYTGGSLDFAVYDIETHNWTTFVCGAIYDRANGYRLFHAGQEDEMADAIAEYDCDVYAHFGGGFDHLWLISNLIRRGKIDEKMVIYPSGIRAVTMKIPNGPRLLDSFAIFPTSLEAFTSGLGIQKQKLNLDCVCGDKCGGYCSITLSMPPHLYRRLIEYLESDVMSLYQAVSRVKEFAAANGIVLGPTIGSTGWKFACSVCPGLDSVVMPRTSTEYLAARAVYFGGYTKALKHVRDARATLIDVNSSYPTSMRDCAFAVGAPLPRQKVRDPLDPELYAVIDAEVTVFDTYMPSLPVRFEGNFVRYPTGRFRGVWTSESLRGAVRRGDARIEKINHFTAWHTERIYGPFVDRLYAMRAEAGNETPLGTWCKLVMNSLSGKLAARPWHRRYEINGQPKVCTCKKKPCECGSATLIADDIVEAHTFRIEPNAVVMHAAQITASAAQRVFDAAKGVGHEHSVYCDTDSLIHTAEDSRVTIGKAIGEWSEKKIDELFVYGAKLYKFRGPNKRGELVSTAKAKGIHRIDAAKLVPGIEVELTGASGVKKTLESGHHPTHMSRRIRETWGDRVALEDGIDTRPKTYAECLEKPRARKRDT